MLSLCAYYNLYEYNLNRDRTNYLIGDEGSYLSICQTYKLIDCPSRTVFIVSAFHKYQWLTTWSNTSLHLLLLKSSFPKL